MVVDHILVGYLPMIHSTLHVATLKAWREHDILPVALPPTTIKTEIGANGLGGRSRWVCL
jgi:hypothetical protein